MEPSEIVDTSYTIPENLKDYYAKHMHFNPTQEEAKIISGSLSLNNQGKVKIGGAFLLPFIGLCLGFLANTVSLMRSFQYLTLLGIALFGGIVLIQSLIIIFTILRKKMVKQLFWLQYGIQFILSITAFSANSAGVMIASAFWSLYFYKSVRVKYTFVE